MDQDKSNEIAELDLRIREVENENVELREEIATDEAVLHAIGDGLVVVNMNGEIVLVNSTFEQLLDWKSQEVLGKNVTEVIVKQDEKGNTISSKERFQEIHSLVAHQTGKDNFYYLRKNGSRFPVSITTTPVLMDGVQIGIVQIFRDITEEKAIEKAKGEFVSLASHQLRTPISAINWNAEMLANDNSIDPDQRKHTIETIIHANERMTQIVNSLVNVSRLELGTFEISNSIVDIVNLTVQILSKFKPLADLRNVTVLPTFDLINQNINTDPSAIQIILENLISNAIKYSKPNGHVKISISSPQGSLLVEVEDDGHGIPENDQDKIYSKLFRASNATNIDTDGMGVGLYVAHGIIKLMNGQIWFESKENIGTKFSVRIPTN